MGRLCAVMAKPLQKYWNLIFLRVEWCLFRQYSLLHSCRDYIRVAFFASAIGSRNPQLGDDHG